MSIDLHELIRDGGKIVFRQALSTERLDMPSVLEYVEPPVGEGEITCSADVLMLRGRIAARLLCRCDRCAREFERSVEIPLEVPLATELEDEEDPDYFLLENDALDIDDLLESGYILGMDQQMLCRPDCKGLCPRCGADLNNGPCGCRKESDPRLAVLEQLLDDTEHTN